MAAVAASPAWGDSSRSHRIASRVKYKSDGREMGRFTPPSMHTTSQKTVENVERGHPRFISRWRIFLCIYPYSASCRLFFILLTSLLLLPGPRKRWQFSTVALALEKFHERNCYFKRLPPQKKTHFLNNSLKRIWNEDGTSKRCKFSSQARISLTFPLELPKMTQDGSGNS